ncbi:transcriptional regulator [Flexivirga endophytica]|uniref:Transcriptional regulator n=1 Tax=Flexivirga endophytica TaxID=1849103 RepID=A0A916TIS2_9MICO|nr:PadR family transcriptional regulator [Flexivirga endophytica]GGB47387.1 transcriptional regulator [Flexivirga endophytica]GHB67133.1 transcriptional regulator [Flexivirga endophytica]
MSIKHSLLALLQSGPMYGAQLRQEFEHRTGGTWPLNVGQVYTTLGRLERDALVVSTGAADEEGRIAYQLTDAGRAEVQQWWSVPVGREQTPRNELAIKLALAVTLPGVDVQQIVQTQRTATMTHLRDLTRLKRGADGEDLAWELVLESLIFADEAEVRWLDHVEARISRLTPTRAKASRTAPVATAENAGAREGARR